MGRMDPEGEPGQRGAHVVFGVAALGGGGGEAVVAAAAVLCSRWVGRECGGAGGRGRGNGAIAGGGERANNNCCRACEAEAEAHGSAAWYTVLYYCCPCC